MFRCMLPAMLALAASTPVLSAPLLALPAGIPGVSTPALPQLSSLPGLSQLPGLGGLPADFGFPALPGLPGAGAPDLGLAGLLTPIEGTPSLPIPGNLPALPLPDPSALNAMGAAVLGPLADQAPGM